MSDTLISSMGLKGRVVIPAPIRERHDWEQGTILIFIETDAGVIIRDRDGALAEVRRDLAGASLSQELIEDRRREVEAEVR
ncbi:MAG: AbrB/MazE/SpoVT family DNA-binding domain-containing protein [Propionibacteriaceae bacterium]|jgi:AbrB family looped-hinge helix DNA binding protein|nr:AbrB/MazE/SpoVT family DNA-binding domain-containing protein [Propionibacteriaceae bacterium]